MPRPMTLHGIPVVIANPANIEKHVKRTWKERLLSLSPWKSYKVEYELVDILEHGRIIKGHNSFIMTASTWEHCKNAIDSHNPFEVEEED
tara:strand:- start:942 stop:1211 length:270 start_codon:yes stop_codon:yes gene_type:complete